MKKEKGFTLVELLAMLVILGILIGITIPNVTGILKNQKLNIIKTDATNMVERAKTKIAKDSKIIKPAVGHCLIFTLNYLNDHDEFDKGPNGGTYDEFESFVLYTRVNSSGGTTKFKYYVRLVEKTDSGNFGFNLEDIDNISELKNDNIIKLSSLYGLTKNRTDSVGILNGTSDISAKCATLVNDDYYIHTIV